MLTVRVCTAALLASALTRSLRFRKKSIIRIIKQEQRPIKFNYGLRLLLLPFRSDDPQRQHAEKHRHHAKESPEPCEALRIRKPYGVGDLAKRGKSRHGYAEAYDGENACEKYCDLRGYFHGVPQVIMKILHATHLREITPAISG